MNKIFLIILLISAAIAADSIEDTKDIPQLTITPPTPQNQELYAFRPVKQWIRKETLFDLYDTEDGHCLGKVRCFLIEIMEY